MTANHTTRPPRNRYPHPLDGVRGLSRHHPIEMPNEGSSLLPDGPDGERTSSIDPKSSDYDENQTVAYHLAQLPKQPAFDTGITARAPVTLMNPKFALESRDIGTGVLSMILHWSIDHRSLLLSGNIEYDELGYDENGFVCSISQSAPPPADTCPRVEVKEHIVCAYLTFLSPFFSFQRLIS